MDQARLLIRLLGEMGEMSSLRERKQHLVQGLGRILHSPEVAVVLDEDFGPGRPGRVVDYATAFDDDHARIHARYRQYFEQGACFDPSLRQMMTLSAEGETTTHRRREIVRDRDWYEAGLFSDFMRALHVDDSVLSCRRLPGPNRVRGLTVRRQVGDRRFTAEERNLVHLCNLELETFIGDAALPVDLDGVSLSPRERDTLDLLLRGSSEKEVASQLGLSQNTVHVYVKALYKRFNVRSRAELLARFVRPRRGGQGKVPVP